MLDAVIEERTAASRRCFKNGQEWGKKCFEDLDQRRMGRPATRTWSTDYLLREESSREERGKWLKNKSVAWRRRRRLRQVVIGTVPWTADAKVWVQKNGGVHVVSEGA
jgi:hypothetical protein